MYFLFFIADLPSKSMPKLCSCVITDMFLQVLLCPNRRQCMPKERVSWVCMWVCAHVCVCVCVCVWVCVGVGVCGCVCECGCGCVGVGERCVCMRVCVRCVCACVCVWLTILAFLHSQDLPICPPLREQTAKFRPVTEDFTSAACTSTQSCTSLESDEYVCYFEHSSYVVVPL